MANPRNIHLFNCDRTYKLDVVENWLTETETKAKSGRGFYFSVKQHYFALPQMLEMSTETIPGLEMDLAVFVVHAHESRLSINEDNAGIGYAKIYRALQERTKGEVIIVIGGDDNYKDKEEEGRDVISRWAKRKVSSQFSEEFMDGRKGFILSWDKKHRIIHEEALLHFLDPSKKEKKFEYQTPKREPPPQTLQRPLARGQEQPRMKPGETLTQQPQDSGNPRQRDDYSKENKTDRHHKGACHSQSINERERAEETITPQRPDIKDPLRSDDLFEERYTGDPCYQLVKRKNRPKETIPQQRTHIKDPLRSDDSYDQMSKERNRPEETIPQQRPDINDLPGRGSKADFHHPRKPERVRVVKDLSVLGWNAKQESMSAVIEYIQKLNLTGRLDVRNENVQDLVTYLQTHPLKYCVVVVDAEKVKTVATEKDHHHLKLLKAAETNVEAKIIVAVSFSPSTKYKDDEETCKCLIKSTFKDENKALVFSIKNGKLQVEGDDLVSLLTLAFADRGIYPQQQSKASSSQQYLDHETSQPYAQVNTTASLSQGFQNPNVSSSIEQYVPQPQAGATANHPLYPSAGVFDYILLLPPLKTIMVLTRLRNGRISNRREDVEYWMSGFIVPDSMERGLLNHFQEENDIELAVLQEKEKIIPLVDEKIDRRQFIRLELNEILVLETRLKNGRISFEKNDVVFRHHNLQVPEHICLKLQKDFETTGNAKLFVISDAEGNFRTIVQVGTFQHFKGYVMKKIKNI